MTLKAKLLLGGTVMTAAIIYVAYLGASSSWQYYLLVDECVAQASQLHGKRLRVSGRVADDSLSISADRREASFRLLGHEQSLQVSQRGPLPDNLAEGIEVVVEGSLRPDGQLQGDKVITRCASKYAPEETGGSAQEGGEGRPSREGAVSSKGQDPL
jgi:cytochrome c-type biogenesis protein CcmE